MKSIQLTKKQRDKLLEMCKALFPEYTNVYFRIDSKSSLIYPIEGMVDNNILRMGSFSGELDLSIHWFEFCLTHLAEKIIATYKVNQLTQRIYKRTLNDDLSKFYLESLDFSRGFNKQHPINYLYEKFKKLK
jgi:hypothetical protein